MSVKVTIYGTEYPIQGEADPEYIELVAAYLDGKMREVGRSLTVKSTTKVAVLAALNIADELFRARQAGGQLQQQTEERLASLAERIREELAQS